MHFVWTNNWETCWEYSKPRCYYLPPGSLHALGASKSLACSRFSLNWHKTACMSDIMNRLIWMKSIGMLFTHVQSGAHRTFHWRIIAVLTLCHAVRKFADITGAPNLYLYLYLYLETWLFVAFSEQWRGVCGDMRWCLPGLGSSAFESSTSIYHICKYKYQFKYSKYLKDIKYTKCFFNQVQVNYKYFGNKQ